jgi:hypothetical protein
MGHPLLLESHLPAGESHGLEASEPQKLVPLRVPLPGLPSAVKGVTVGLDRQSLPAPEEVDLDRAAVAERHPGVDLGCGKGRRPAECEKRFLELACREARAVQILEH